MQANKGESQVAKRPWQTTRNELVVPFAMLIWALGLLQLFFSTHDPSRWHYFWSMFVLEMLLLFIHGLNILDAWINYFKSKNKTSSAQ